MRSLILAFLCLAACGKGDASSNTIASAPAVDRWSTRGAESACKQRLFEGSRFTVCDPHGGRLQLFAASPSQEPLRSFSAIAQEVDADSVAFAMNAGMFDEKGRPIGLAIVDRFTIHPINLRNGPGNFHLQPNGVFMVARGSPSVTVSAPLPLERTPTIDLATQSGPMLVIDGKLHPKLEPDGKSRYIRNGVGVRNGNALFVISQDPVSLGKFARFFRDGLKTPNALYFDGSVSSLWDPADGRQDSHSLLGPIIVAFKTKI
jgi:uncharacterized protein YigE (DUF2233 family)